MLVLLEVVDGRRPVSQLRGRLDERAADSVLAAQRSGTGASRRVAMPVHVTRPSSRAFELCTTISEGERYRAVAARVELRRGAWLCTRFHLL